MGLDWMVILYTVTPRASLQSDANNRDQNNNNNNQLSSAMKNLTKNLKFGLYLGQRAA